ncbi:MAG: DegT/DnrJ/EryC1/StrS family aminotransferase, partial [Phycisphaerae bacterium]
ARSLRNHGEIRRYVHERVGGNFRLDTLKAAVLLAKLDHFDEFTRLRRRNAASYTRLLAGAPVVTPRPEDHHEPVYHQYSILADRRDELVEFLQARGVSTGIYYPVGLHLQPCFVSLGYSPGSLPVTEEVCDRILSVPCHPMLSEADLEFVASCVHAFYGTSGPAGGGLAEVGD